MALAIDPTAFLNKEGQEPPPPTGEQPPSPAEAQSQTAPDGGGVPIVVEPEAMLGGQPSRRPSSALIDALIQTESGGRADAVSPKGARGPAQIMPHTARDPGFGVKPVNDPHDPEEARRFAGDYLGALITKYGDEDKALMAYNMGPGRMDRWLKSGANPDHLPTETRQYVEKVRGRLGDGSLFDEPATISSAPSNEEPKRDTPAAAPPSRFTVQAEKRRDAAAPPPADQSLIPWVRDAQPPQAAQPQAPAEEPKLPEMTIEVPGHGQVKFPAGMTRTLISKAIYDNFPDMRQSAPAAFGNAVGQGVVSAASTAMQGLNALLAKPEWNRFEVKRLAQLYQSLQPEDRQKLRAEVDKRYANRPDVRRSALFDAFRDIDAGHAADAPEQPMALSERRLFRIAKQIERGNQIMFPVQPELQDKWYVQFGNGLGSTAALIPFAMVPGAGGSALGYIAGGLMGSGEAAQRAQKAGASEEQIIAAAYQGIAPGAVDFLPIDRFAQQWTRNPGLRAWMYGVAKRSAAQAGMEGSTEAIQQIMQNMIAKANYKPDQPLTEDVIQNFLLGAAVGSTFGTAGRFDVRKPGAPVEESAAAPQETLPPAEPSAEPVSEPAGLESAAAPETSPPRDTGTGLRAALDEARGEQEPTPAQAALAEAQQSRIEGALGTAMLDTGQSVRFTDPATGEVTTGKVHTYDLTPDGKASISIVDEQNNEIFYGDPETAQVTPLSGDGTKAAPLAVESAADADIAARNVAEPTDGQMDAGNYQHGHLKWNGLDIAIETPKGGTRRAKDGSWIVPDFPAHYGYVKRSEGSDGDQVDVYMGPDLESNRVFIVNQIGADTGLFDELKVIIGTPDLQSAIDIYTRAFSDGRGVARIGGVVEMSSDAFRAFVKRGGGRTALSEGEAGARLVSPSTIRNVAQSLGSGAQPEQSILPQLRGPGDQGASAVADVSRLSQGGRGAADTETSDRPEGQRRPLRTEQSPVGNPQGAGAQHAQEPASDVSRSNATPDGLGGGNRAGSLNSSVSAEAGRDVGGGRAIDRPQGRTETASGPVTEPPADAELKADNTQTFDVIEPDPAIKDSLLKIAKRINPSVEVAFVDRILAPSGPAEASGIEPGGEAAGLYSAMHNLILIAKAGQNAETAYHELFHSIDDLLTPQEQKVVYEGAKTSAKHGNTDRERAAYAFGAWAVGREKYDDAPKMVRAFQKLKAFIQRVISFLKGQGITTMDDVFEKVYRGGAKPTQRSTADTGIHFSRRPYEGATNSLMGFRKRGPNKGWDEQAYKFIQHVRVTFPDGQVHIDAQKGLNRAHAIERAHRNWDGAKIEPITEAEAREADPSLSGFDPAGLAFSRLPERTVADALSEINRPLWDRIRRGASPQVIKTTLDRIRHYIQDRMLTMRRYQEDIRKRGGRVTPAQDVYGAEELFSGRAGAKLRELQQTHVEPLVEFMAEHGIGLDNLNLYLYARHARERNARIAEINPEMPDGGSGMTNEQADQVMADFMHRGMAARLEEAAQRIDAINRLNLRERVQAGLMTQEQATEWQTRYPHWVPLRGFAELDPDEGASSMPRIGRGFDVRGSESRAALGRESLAADIVPNAIMLAEEGIIRGEKNRVGVSLYNLVRAHPDPEVWEIWRGQTRQVLDPATGQVREYWSQQPPPAIRDRSIAVKIGGKEALVVLHDERLLRTMKTLNVENANIALRMLMLAGRYFSQINTSYNPEFIIVNALRDLETGTINIQAQNQQGVAREIWANYLKALRGSYRGLRNVNINDPWRRYFLEFERAGGKVSFYKIDDLNERRANLQRDLQRAAQGPFNASRLARETKRLVEDANAAVDNSMRLATFVALRNRGYTAEQAASVAKNLTVNFNRRGEIGHTINALYVFFNAGIQGTFTLLQAFARSRKVRAITGGIVVAGALMDFLNSLLSDDDDDGELFYDKISAYDKSRNMILMIPGAKGDFVKIPMAYGYNAFFDLGRNVAAVARGKQSVAKGMANTLGTASDAFNPLGGGNSFLNLLAPTLIDPVVDIWMNRSFFGRPINPSPNPFQAQGPNSENAYPQTSPSAKAVARFMNWATGGDEYTKGLVDMNPGSIEYAFQQYLGAAGQFVQRAAELPVKIVQGQEVRWNDIPFARRVVGETGVWSDRQLAYDRIKEVEDAARRIKASDAGEDKAAYERAEKDVGWQAEMAGAAKQLRKDLSAVRKERNEINADQKLTPRQKQQKLKVLEADEKEKLVEWNRAFNEAEKAHKANP